MNPIIQKTLGGLSASYYIRQFIFGLMLTILFYFMLSQGGTASAPVPIATIIFMIVSTFLYPYARFTYEKIVAFILGDNVFFINAIVMLVIKFITMVICWAFSIFIAPLGLAYLFYIHSKNIE